MVAERILVPSGATSDQTHSPREEEIDEDDDDDGGGGGRRRR